MHGRIAHWLDIERHNYNCAYMESQRKAHNKQTVGEKTDKKRIFRNITQLNEYGKKVRRKKYNNNNNVLDTCPHLIR